MSTGEAARSQGEEAELLAKEFAARVSELKFSPAAISSLDHRTSPRKAIDNVEQLVSKHIEPKLKRSISGVARPQDAHLEIARHEPHIPQRKLQLRKRSPSPLEKLTWPYSCPARTQNSQRPELDQMIPYTPRRSKLTARGDCLRRRRRIAWKNPRRSKRIAKRDSK